MKCPRCQQENPPQAKFCLDCAAPISGDTPAPTSPAEIKAEIEGLRRSLTEALEQQAATSGILRVISRSPSSVQPVLDTVVEHASRLCSARDAQIFHREGEHLRLVAHHGPIPTGAVGEFTMPISRGTVNGRSVSEQRPVQVADLRAESVEFPEGQAIALKFGHRTVLTVPLMRDGAAIGTLAVRRAEVRPFTDAQVALLQTFADQAVIAIENVRLFTELQEKNHALTTAHAQVTEALDQQTATAEILRVISSSPTEVQPVFDTIAERAMRLCNANQGLVGTFDGERIHLRALANFDASGAEAMRRVFPILATQGSVLGRTVLTKTIVQIPSMLADPEYRLNSLAEVAGFRSALGVPMLKDGHVVGAVAVTSPEARVFTDREIALLQTFADQAVIAIENVRLFMELQQKNRALTQAHAQVTEALERQTATSDILKVMAGSPTATQPVFDTIAENAARLCAARDAQVLQVDGDVLRLVSAYGLPSMPSVRSISRGHAVGRAVIDRQTIHVRDMAQAIAELPETTAPQYGVQSVLAVPLVRHHVAIGVIRVSRTEIRPFTEAQIALLQTFADQAVIAIENVRLFTELQTRNSELTEGLERETATGEILRVISSSPTDIQPVLAAILDSGRRLCDAEFGAIFRFEDGAFMNTASTTITSELDAWLQRNPIRPGPETPLRRVGIERRPVQVADILSDPDFAPPDEYRREGMRTALAVPMLKEGTLVGALTFHRRIVKPFGDQQIKLLETFADQAVIAIENVRLFTELQEKNSALTEALDQQTATAEILRVISSSPTDLQPVFDTIVRSASRLCAADFGGLHFLDGDRITLEAHYNARAADYEAWRRGFPIPLGRATASGRAIHSRIPVHIADVQADPEYTAAVSSLEGHRTIVAVPMLREGIPIGTVVAWRREVHPFTDQQIEILQTFANQAVIAIENVRLFKELEARTQDLTRSVDELTALGEVSRVLSSTLDLETVLQTIVRRANDLAGTAGCTIWEYDEARGEFRLRASDFPDETDAAGLESVDRVTTIRKGVGVTTQVMEQRQPVQVLDIAVGGAEENPIRRRLIEAGHHSLLGVPLLSEDEVIGVLAVTRKTPGEFEPDIVRLLSTFATQSALAIQNARLFLEIEDKSRQLEAASQHKSEFLANMSHELRTPLNAIIGFSEVLGERMFGELNAKQEEYLKDIHASGQHLLSLINDILDLSKIEAGRMELELVAFHLPQAIENALALVRERALRRGITLGQSIDPNLAEIRADERKLKQVLLNLLSNAIKFTPEGGRIEVRAKPVNGSVEVSVSDTGVGIAPEDQEAIFEEFRQVGTAARKVEGTGLGLALSRKFIELHGGRIWVESQVGVGSTFTFRIPVSRGE